MQARHDELLLRDLKLQPIALLLADVEVGGFAFAVGVVQGGTDAPAWLCAGGGFLIALGAETRVTRRIRRAALAVLESRATPADRATP